MPFQLTWTDGPETDEVTPVGAARVVSLAATVPAPLVVKYAAAPVARYRVAASTRPAAGGPPLRHLTIFPMAASRVSQATRTAIQACSMIPVRRRMWLSSGP